MAILTKNGGDVNNRNVDPMLYHQSSTNCATCLAEDESSIFSRRRMADDAPGMVHAMCMYDLAINRL